MTSNISQKGIIIMPEPANTSPSQTSQSQQSSPLPEAQETQETPKTQGSQPTHEPSAHQEEQPLAKPKITREEIAQRYRERAAGAAVFFSTAVGRSPFLSLRFPFVRKSLRQRLCPSGHAFSGAKVLPWRNIQVPLRYLNTIFQ